MPWGAVATACAVIMGGFFGTHFGKKVKMETRERMTSLFGVIAMTFGITGVIKVVNLPAVVLSVILGTVIGEIIDMERILARLGATLEKGTSKLFNVASDKDPDRTDMIVNVLVMFCFTSTGIYGAMYSGMTGDHSLLFSKAMTDFVVSGLFAASIGYVMMAIAIPQFTFFVAMFYLARLVLPILSDAMIMDFTACGGILMLATGLRMAKIKDYHIGNMLPALIVVFPLSALWMQIMG